MDAPTQLPGTWRDGVWALVVLLLATRKWTTAGVVTAWNILRSANAANNKTNAEAEEIRARTEISVAGLIREMTVSQAQAMFLSEKLKEEHASDKSIIELQRATIAQLEDENAKLKGTKLKNGTSGEHRRI